MKKPQIMFLLSALLMSVGCTETTSDGTTATESKPSDTTAAAQPSAAGAKYVLAAEPAGAKDILAVREASKDGDDVVLVGRIGGSEKPWVEGTAAFTIVDMSLQACVGEGENCPTPWDYCCSTDKLPTATALVKFVDDQGQMVKQDARELMGLKELQIVVVQGKANRDEAGNLTVLASRLYVRK